MEIYFALPVAILRIAFITENETKEYRFDLVAFHISIVHYVSLERKLSIVKGLLRRLFPLWACIFAFRLYFG